MMILVYRRSQRAWSVWQQKCSLCSHSIDNNWATTKAPKFVQNTKSIWKAPALIGLIWMFHIFRNVSRPPPETQTRKCFLGECGLFFSRLAYRGKNVCILWQEEEDRKEETRHEEIKGGEGGEEEMNGADTGGAKASYSEAPMIFFILFLESFCCGPSILFRGLR